VILFLFYACSIPKIQFANKLFIGDYQSYKVESFNFINDSVCLYLQEFQCDIDGKYKKTEIVCNYTVSGKYLILRNVTLNAPYFLEGKSCFKLPDMELKKCFPEDGEIKPIVIGKPRELTDGDVFGYINNIDIDTLYLHKGYILYGKSVRCVSNNGMYVGTLFHDKNKGVKLSQKQKNEMLNSRKIPVN
jgi:hypothetical protein